MKPVKITASKGGAQIHGFSTKVFVICLRRDVFTLTETPISLKAPTTAHMKSARRSIWTCKEDGLAAFAGTTASFFHIWHRQFMIKKRLNCCAASERGARCCGIFAMAPCIPTLGEDKIFWGMMSQKWSFTGRIKYRRQRYIVQKAWLTGRRTYVS